MSWWAARKGRRSGFATAPMRVLTTWPVRSWSATVWSDGVHVPSRAAAVGVAVEGGI